MIQNDVLDAALELAPKARIELAEALWDSVDEIDSELKQAWVDEAQSRLDGYDRGEIKAVPADLVHNRLRAKFQR